MKHTLIILIILFLSIGVKSENTDSLNKVKVESNLHKETIDTKSDNIDYRLLYENQKDYHKDLLSTVFWALGSILVVILAIVGSNLYLNFRFNKKQYDNLITKYEVKINNLEKTLNEKVNQKIKKFQDDSNVEFVNYKEELTNLQNEKVSEMHNGFKERLDSFSDNLKEQILSIKDRYDNLNKLVEKNAGDFEDKLNSLDKSFNENLEMRLMKLNINISDIEAEMWKSKGVFSNALYVYIEQSINSITVDWMWNLKYTLRSVIDMLTMVEKVDERHYELFDKLMPLIPGDYSIQKSEIKELLYKFKKEE